MILYEKELTEHIIGAAIEVHRQLGPGLLESTYVICFCREIEMRGLAFDRERPVPVEYKGRRVEHGYRADVIVEGKVVVEIKAIEAIAPVHEAQLLTYLKLTGCRIGLLLNFNVACMKHGIRRRVL